METKLVKIILQALNHQCDEWAWAKTEDLKQREHDWLMGVCDLALRISYYYENRPCFEFDNGKREYFYWLPQGDKYTKLFADDIKDTALTETIKEEL